MKFLRNLETKLNEKANSYEGARELGIIWKNHLKNTPWADRTSILDSITYNECLNFPLFQVQYELLLENDVFSLRNHPSWSGNCSWKPSEKGIRELLTALGTNYEDLLEDTKNLFPVFHDAYYRGPVESFEREPPIPLIVKRLTDRTVAGCYWDLFEVSSQQWALQLNIKLYHLFSNKRIKIKFDITAFDNATYDEGDWPMESLYPLNSPEEREINCPTSLEFPPNPALNSYRSLVRNLLDSYNVRLDELFNNRDTPRMELSKRQSHQQDNKFIRPDILKH